VNGRLASDLEAQGLFLTVGYALLDPASGQLQVASAGHTPILLRRANGETALLERTGPALGLTGGAEFGQHRLALEPGDRLVLYTDGVIDGLRSHRAEEIVGLFAPALGGSPEGGPERLRALYRDVDRRERTNGGGGRDDVTLLVLEAAGGPSCFDNEPVEEDAPAAPAGPPHAPAPPTLWLAREDGTTWIVVRGRAAWTQSELFHRLAGAALETGGRLVVDLSGCEHMDSTFLGTLHELVTSAAPGRVSVRRPSELVRSLFDELGLERVTAAIDDGAAEPTADPAPVLPSPPERASQERLLRAHELLSELSDENRERFAGLVQALRAELGGAGEG
jgi:anti-anti-sigma regulatory factor